MPNLLTCYHHIIHKDRRQPSRPLECEKLKKVYLHLNLPLPIHSDSRPPLQCCTREAQTAESCSHWFSSAAGHTRLPSWKGSLSIFLLSETCSQTHRHTRDWSSFLECVSFYFLFFPRHTDRHTCLPSWKGCLSILLVQCISILSSFWYCLAWKCKANGFLFTPAVAQMALRAINISPEIQQIVKSNFWHAGKCLQMSENCGKLWRGNFWSRSIINPWVTNSETDKFVLYKIMLFGTKTQCQLWSCLQPRVCYPV